MLILHTGQGLTNQAPGCDEAGRGLLRSAEFRLVERNARELLRFTRTV